MHLSILVPAFNEALRIRPGLEKAIDFLKKQSFSWEIIIVDDGSSDETAAVVAGLSKKEKNVRLISLGRNFGKGHAIRMGVEAAGGDFIIFTDADFSVPIKLLPYFLKKLKKKDIVYGSRRAEGAEVIKHQNFFRESLGHSFTKFSCLILGLRVSDMTCGFKGFKLRAAKKLFSVQRLNRWAFDAEVLFLAKKYKMKTLETPVIWKNVKGTKVFLLKDIFASFIDLLKIRIYDLLGAY